MEEMAHSFSVFFFLLGLFIVRDDKQVFVFLLGSDGTQFMQEREHKFFSLFFA
jgi:hypothetical protein